MVGERLVHPRCPRAPEDHRPAHPDLAFPRRLVVAAGVRGYDGDLADRLPLLSRIRASLAGRRYNQVGVRPVRRPTGGMSEIVGTSADWDVGAGGLLARTGREGRLRSGGQAAARLIWSLKITQRWPWSFASHGLVETFGVFHALLKQ